MSYIYRNISDVEVATLIYLDELGERKVKSMSICNTHATDSVDVDLYYYRTEEIEEPENSWNEPVLTSYSYHLLKNYTLLKGNTLLLNDYYDIVFDNTKYSFLIKLSAADSTVDVIITT